ERSPQAAAPKPKPKQAWQIFAVPQNTRVVTCSAETAQVCPGIATLPQPGVTYYYLFEHDLQADEPVPQMTGDMLNLDGTRADVDPQTGAPVVLMKFTGKGDRAFHEITGAEARRGAAVGQPQH